MNGTRQEPAFPLHGTEYRDFSTAAASASGKKEEETGLNELLSPYPGADGISHSYLLPKYNRAPHCMTWSGRVSRRHALSSPHSATSRYYSHTHTRLQVLKRFTNTYLRSSQKAGVLGPKQPFLFPSSLIILGGGGWGVWFVGVPICTSSILINQHFKVRALGQ